jgi:hypothetical protein
MKTRLFVVPLLALMVAGGGAAARADDTTPAATPPPTATTLRMRGTIGKYDAATRTLSLMTADGTLQMHLAQGARISHGWRDVDESQLEKLAGYRAAVRYSESGGNKMAESIHVFGKRERTEQ